jgi:hypothetical protein
MARLNWLKSLKVRKLRIKTKFCLVVIWWLNGGHLVVKWWSFGGQNGKKRATAVHTWNPRHWRVGWPFLNGESTDSLMLFS